MKILRELGMYGKHVRVETPHYTYDIVPHAEAKLRVFADGVIIDERPKEPFQYVLRFTNQSELKKFLQKLEAHSTVIVFSPSYTVGKKTLERKVEYFLKDLINVAKAIWSPQHGHKETNYTRYNFKNCKVL